MEWQMRRQLVQLANPFTFFFLLSYLSRNTEHQLQGNQQTRCSNMEWRFKSSLST